MYYADYVHIPLALAVVVQVTHCAVLCNCCAALRWLPRSVQELDLTMSDEDAQHLCSSPMFVDTVVSLADAGTIFVCLYALMTL